MNKPLTVKELIVQLSLLPDDAVVTNEACEPLYVHHVGATQVFITDVSPEEVYEEFEAQFFDPKDFKGYC